MSSGRALRREGPGGPSPARSGRGLAVAAAAVAVALVAVLGGDLLDTLRGAPRITYPRFLDQVVAGRVDRVQIDEGGRVVGVLDDGSAFETRSGGAGIPPADVELLDRHHVVRGRAPVQPNVVGSLLLVWLLPICLAVVAWRGTPLPAAWRRASGAVLDVPGSGPDPGAVTAPAGPARRSRHGRVACPGRGRPKKASAPGNRVGSRAREGPAAAPLGRSITKG